MTPFENITPCDGHLGRSFIGGVSIINWNSPILVNFKYHLIKVFIGGQWMDLLVSPFILNMEGIS